MTEKRNLEPSKEGVEMLESLKKAVANALEKKNVSVNMWLFGGKAELRLLVRKSKYFYCTYSIV